MQLQHLLIPPRVRGFDDGRPAGQAYELVLEGAKVASIAAVDGPATGVLLPALVDAHTHLDKNYTVERIGAVQGDLFAAIAKMAEARAAFTADDVRERMVRGLQDAWRSGTRAIRTHLDWWQAAPPVSLAVFEQLRDEWAGRVELQCVSLTPLDLFDDAFAGEDIALEVARVNAQGPTDGAGVLGAFVYRNADLDRKLRRVFDLALKHGLKIDFHVDEGLHTDAVGLAAIAKLAQHTGHGAHVTCSHCCSLSVQPDEQAQATLAECAQAGLNLIALPTTNLYLQGAWDRTPVERGITRLREAAALGLRGCIATDNVADGFYPYGSYDLLETYCLGVQVAHLAPALDWVDAITTSPARAMGLAWDGRIAPGCPADLVRLDAGNEFELLSPAGRKRTVIRAGRPL